MIRLKPDPMGESRNPFQVFLLCLCIFSAWSILADDVPSTVGTIEYYLNTWQEVIWSTLLIGGSGFALLGMFWPYNRGTGLILKRFGFNVLCVPIFMYGLLLVFKFGFGGLTMATILWGFAIASGTQARRVNKRIKEVLKK